MLSQNNISHVFVAEGTGLSTGAVSALATGQIGVHQNGETSGDAGALVAGDRFQVFLKDLNGNLVNSPMIDFDNIRSSNAVNYTAPTEKLVYIGYNGTTGSLEVNNSTVYTMHMNIQDGTKTWGEHPLFKMVAAYESDATATETEIADALVLNAVKNFEREVALGVDYIKVGRISSAATAAGYDFDGNFVVVQGSPVATATSTGQYNTGSAIAVGDYVRVGATTTTAVALTSQVYKVTALSGAATNVITFDRPILEASGTYATASNYTQVIPSLTALAADWGLSFQGKPLAFDPGLKKYQKVIFDVQLGDGFGSTLNTVSTGASKGEGSYMQVAENEWLLTGNRGEPYRVASYPVSKSLGASSVETYDTVVVHFTNNNSIQIDREVKSYISLVFYVVNDTAGTSGSTAYTNLKTVFGL